MTKTIDKIKLNRNFNMSMETYLDIVEETKKGAKGMDLATKHRLSYTTVAKVRSHARRAGLLELSPKAVKMAKTKAVRKSQRKFRQKQEERRAVAAEVIPAVKQDPGFIKVDFKGTEIHVQKTGKIMITEEGIVVR
jgi:hypothetical protein